MTDLILSGGTLFDGMGGEPVRADVGITDDTITADRRSVPGTGGATLDVSGCAVAPGFIDIHTHSDFSLLLNRPMRSSLAQGVTTEVVGNCGVSIALMFDDAIFAQEKRWAERGGMTINWSRPREWLRRVEDGRHRLQRRHARRTWDDP